MEHKKPHLNLSHLTAVNYKEISFKANQIVPFVDGTT